MGRVLTLLLVVTTLTAGVLWLRSLTGGDYLMIRWLPVHMKVEAESLDGLVSFECQDPAWSGECPFLTRMVGWQPPALFCTYGSTLIVRYWVLMAVAAAWPLWRSWRWWRGRNARGGGFPVQPARCNDITTTATRRF